MGLLAKIKVFFRWKQEVTLVPQKQGATLDVLSHLQREGRLVDFLQEDISGFSDQEVGAAVRKIHEDCHKFLATQLKISPLLSDREGSVVTVQSGYNPLEIKVVGNVKGKAPYRGVVKHGGWKAKDGSVIYPAEVEVS
ncbi:MAG: DUF2760 domain-containing protein [Chlamydiales bacterium]